MLKGEQSTSVPADMAAHLPSSPPHSAQPSPGNGLSVTRSPAPPTHHVSRLSSARLSDVAQEAGGDGGLLTPAHAVQAGPAVAGQAHGRAGNVTGQRAGVQQPVAVHRSTSHTASARPPARTRPLMKVRPHLIDHQTHHTRTVCMRGCTYTHTRTHPPTHTHTHTRALPRACARTHTHTHSHTHMHTHTK